MDETIDSLKDKYLGETIWMVGNGPSLDWTNLDLVAEQFSFGINGVGLKFADTIWRPSFYWLSTGYVMDDIYFDRVKKALDLDIPCFINDRLVGMRYWQPWKDRVTWFETLHCGIEKPEPRSDWWDPSTIKDRIVSAFGTSMFATTQIGYFMGFRTFILVGCDMGYKGWKPGTKDINHFGKHYESGKFEMPDEFHRLENPRRIKSHEITFERLYKLGARIYNATIGGELEVYPRVDYFAAAEGIIDHAT